MESVQTVPLLPDPPETYDFGYALTLAGFDVRVNPAWSQNPHCADCVVYGYRGSALWVPVEIQLSKRRGDLQRMREFLASAPVESGGRHLYLELPKRFRPTLIPSVRDLMIRRVPHRSRFFASASQIQIERFDHLDQEIVRVEAELSPRNEIRTSGRLVGIDGSLARLVTAEGREYRTRIKSVLDRALRERLLRLRDETVGEPPVCEIDPLPVTFRRMAAKRGRPFGEAINVIPHPWPELRASSVLSPSA